MALAKLLQRRLYTFLNSRSGISLCLTATVIVLVSGFQFGEMALRWSMDQYDAAFSFYHDNIAGKSFQDKISAPIPIDVVYTWVNGSDPELLEALARVKIELEAEKNRTKERERLVEAQKQKELDRKKNATLTDSVNSSRNARNASRNDAKVSSSPTSLRHRLPQTKETATASKPKKPVKRTGRQGKREKVFSPDIKSNARSLKSLSKLSANKKGEEPTKQRHVNVNVNGTIRNNETEGKATVLSSESATKGRKAPSVRQPKTRVKWEKMPDLEPPKSTEAAPVAKKEEKHVCTGRLCLPAYAVLFRGFPSNVTLKEIRSIDKTFASAMKAMRVTSEGAHKETVTYVQFPYERAAKDVSKKLLTWKKKNVSSTVGYLTDDCEVNCCFKMKNIVLLKSLAVNLTHLELTRAMVQQFSQQIASITLFSNHSIGIIKFSNISYAESALKLPKGNVTVGNRSVSLAPAFVAWDPMTSLDVSKKEEVPDDDIMSANRFQDNEELRYSLRSVEKFVPWIRHIYIVTNGQIPYWLDLDNPRVTVVTHKDLFPNDTHLPTFSSPAIETHIHRIPGLSKKFIYMNDDVLFGKEVYPDDFYSYSGGHRVYLAWQVPQCSEGCPTNWIRDRYCDVSCNNSACDWDGGDCEGKSPRSAYNFRSWHSSSSYSSDPKRYCNVGCADAWLGDRYCDSACNIRECGFDVGDCGMANLRQLHHAELEDDNSTAIHLPLGLSAVYFNLSSIFGDKGALSFGSITKNEIVRTAVIAQRYKVLTVVFRSGFNRTFLSVELTGSLNKTIKVAVAFNFTVDTFTPASGKDVAASLQESNLTSTNKTVPILIRNGSLPYNYWELNDSFVPKKLDVFSKHEYALPLLKNESLLPSDVQAALHSVQTEFDEGDLTDKGYHRKRARILKDFFEKNASMASMIVGTSLPQIFTTTMTTHRNLSEKRLTKDDAEIKASPEKISPSKGAKKGADNRAETAKTKQKEGVKGRKLLAFDDDTEARAGKGDPVEKDAAPVVTDEDVLLADWIANAKQKQLTLAQTLEKAQLDWEENRKAQSRFGRGAFPWEKRNLFDHLVAESDDDDDDGSYETNRKASGRRLLDTFADSLNHVNRLYNKFYGYTSRKVPAHMPHMIDRDVMEELQSTFPAQYEATSSHKLRAKDDMQFAFAYNYFLMSEKRRFNVTQAFEQLDVDKSGILSYRELRTLMAKIYDLPLTTKNLHDFDSIYGNCSRNANYTVPTVSALDLEYNYDDELPLITFDLFRQCKPIIDLLNKSKDSETKYKFQVLGEDDIAFKMISENVTKSVQKLDTIRKDTRKFICINDNVDHSKSSAKIVVALLRDFYESFFPKPSQFELPAEYRNRFLHIDELNEWRRQQEVIRFWVHVAFVVLLLLSLGSFFIGQLRQLKRKIVNFITRLKGNRQTRAIVV